MNQSNTKKLAIAGILCAVAVVGSLFTFPVLASKCAPIQHMVNVLCAVLLGPWYGVGVAFGASLAGKRSFCAMKHVGLNVAADPLFTVAYTGVNAGMVIAVAGLYLLCMKNGFGSIELSDWLLLGCAVLFSFQIMAVDHYSPLVDGVRLSLLEFLVTAIESTLAAFLFETPALADFAANAWPIVFCGVFSSGVAYTLQILGQKDLNPAIASLIMCLESVFSAIGGWLILHQSLSAREGIGCALIFTAVVLAQLPLGKRAESAA